MKKLFTLLLFWLALCSGIAVQAQNLLDPNTQPKFVNSLPLPGVLDARNGGAFTIAISQFEQDLGLVDPISGSPLARTKVWGYNGAYPGPTILAGRDKPVSVLWENKLVSANGVLPHLFRIDTSLHWALKGFKNYNDLGVPVATHLHGGHTEAASDGLPEAWFTPGFALTGKDFVKKTLYYTNDQQAATLWYHDHALGVTRLNVYAGLAGFYLLTDENEKKLQEQYQVPAAPYDIGLAIQDRLFTTDGQLSYSTLPASMGGPENSIQPEFFGNIILVNGKAWPRLKVEPRPYRFRFLNGSDSRFYNLFLSSGQSFIQIGTDNGFLPSPVVMQKLLMGTGERKDVVIDFSDPRLWGRTIILYNNAKTPYPHGSAVDPKNTGQIMAFEVSVPLNASIPRATLPTTLREPIVPLQTTVAPRKLILFETEDEFDRVTPMLGTVEEGIKDWTDPVTEVITQGNTEIWEIYNETADAHPIHLHMVTMQLVNRQKFRASVDMETGKPENIRLLGRPVPPSADESGWKDTYISFPGEVLRVIAKFDLAGQYVWHCHILSHEDNEMMRPYLVTPATQSISRQQNMPANEEQNLQLQALPNPSNGTLQLRFTLDRPSSVVVNVYDSKGSFVKQVYNAIANAGQKQVAINGTGWRSGIYFCEVLIGEKRVMRKLVLEK